jgi:hypothetical protein
VAQAPYFQTYEGNNQNATWGFSKVDVSPSQLSVRFVRGAGGTFTDAYTVTNPSPTPPTTTTTTTTAPPTTSTTTTTTTTTTPPPPGSTTLAPVADTWVGSDATTTAHGSDTALYSVTGSPTKVTYLKFDLKALAGATLTGATLKVTTTSGAYSGSPSAQNVYPVSDTSWSESAMTWATAPALGSQVLGSVPANSAPGTTYTVTLPPSALQQAATAGGLVTLAVKSAAADAFYVNSKEATTARPQLVLTTG